MLLTFTNRTWQLLKGQIDWSQFAIHGENWDRSTYNFVYWCQYKSRIFYLKKESVLSKNMNEWIQEVLIRDQNQQERCYLPGRLCRTRREWVKDVDLGTNISKTGRSRKIYERDQQSRRCGIVEIREERKWGWSRGENAAMSMVQNLAWDLFSL